MEKVNKDCFEVIMMQIVDVNWNFIDQTHFEPGLRIWREGDTDLSFLPLPNGRELSWLIRGPKRCIGSVNENGKLVQCPENAVVFGSAQKCGPCSAVDIMDPCVRCDGRKCDAVDARRLQCESTDYVVYAAIFNDKTLKVGVSSKGRVMIRWVEQGADYAGILREINGGRKARRIEDRIGKLQDITKQVRSERKIRALLDTLTLTEVEELIKDFISKSSGLELNKEVNPIDLSKFYTLPKLDHAPTPWKKRSDQIDNRAIVGEIVGVKGSLMITAIKSSLTVVDLKQLIGYSIDQDSDITLVTQTGLMDYF